MSIENHEEFIHTVTSLCKARLDRCESEQDYRDFAAALGSQLIAATIVFPDKFSPKTIDTIISLLEAVKNDIYSEGDDQ